VKIFTDFKTALPAPTVFLMNVSTFCVKFWFLIPGIPLCFWLFVKLLRKFAYGRAGWDLFILKVPVFGNLVEKNTMARTTRTLGTLVASGVPILEALNITRETSGNAMFERLYGKVTESIREGESIAKPLKEHSVPQFNAVTVLLWFVFLGGPVGVLMYLMRMKKRVVDDLVVNMVDVGEETGELDTMLYKVADTYDEEVAVITESLVSLLEPLLIVFLGLMVGFIVVALFMPLVSLITSLSAGHK
jgi:type IV pilus assembly protein PilC